MKSATTVPQSAFGMLPGYFFLWTAAAIFAAAGAVTRRLIELGEQHLVNGHNPISLCNLLFVGNVCALLVLVPLHWSLLGSLRELGRREWMALVAVAVLAGALAPAFFLAALDLTMVNNVTLVSRLEPLLTLVLAFWVLGERSGRWEVAGAVTACLGVLVTVGLQGGMAMPGNDTLGMSYAAIAAGAQAGATVLGRRFLGRVPVGAFSIVRTGVGTVVFFFLALFLYGSGHFAEAFSPFLWQWMLLYGTLIVVIGQTLWVMGLRRSRTADAALAETFNPLGAVVAAYLILGEVPTMAQVMGGVVILLGLGLGLVGNWKREHERESMTEARRMTGGDMGFRGV